MPDSYPASAGFSFRPAKDTALVQWATEIKVRAERRGGEMTREIPTAPGHKRTSSNDATRTKEETLNDLGITKQEASRWEQVASIPEEHFEAAGSLT